MTQSIAMINNSNGQANLTSWFQTNEQQARSEMNKHGYLFLRGFEWDGPAGFEAFSKEVCGELLKDNGEHQPVKGRVQTPVFFAPEKKLLWHNENTFNKEWPMKIIFGCMRPADSGGESLIVDSREVYQRVSPAVREAFKERGLMYVRNYNPYIGLDWQTVFRTDSKAEAERKCRETGLSYEWKEDGTLKTVAVRPAVGQHPQTGEWAWFNQAQHWHIACLDELTRESLLEIFDEEDLPRACYYGDGSKIDDAIMDEVCSIYEELEVAVALQKGDVLAVDNMLMAHGRGSFEGERKILVTMGDMTAPA